MNDHVKPPSSPDVPTLRPRRAGGTPSPDLPSAPRVPRELSDELPRRLPSIGTFGPYEIVGRLALGGMAEILLAREDTGDAGSRDLVVKRILPEYARDPSFVEMFLDEARVMMRLKHPNVCHVYKFGREDGTPFIAMEWVNGASVGKLIRRARKAGGVPVAIACKVVALVAEALDHAHAATDERGRPLGIVHRDVTPDNLMISYDGAVKLLDFGIAQADSRTHKTQAGVVKGKFAYMAPEQCRAQPLDHRVDVFALGVCLFEALTGRPLYRRETEFETMEAIVRGPVPKLADRMANPPPALEAIIARCLAKQPDDRFASAGELQDALDAFLASQNEVVNARSLKALMATLFKEELKRGPTIDTTPFGSSYHLEPSDAAATAFDDAPPDLGDLPLPDLAPAFDDFMPGAPAPKTPDRRPPPTAPPRVRPSEPAPERGGLGKWLGIGAAALALIGAGAYVGLGQLGSRDEAAAEAGPAPVLTGAMAVDSEPSGATVFVDGREVGTTPVTVEALSTGSHRVRLVLAGHQDHEGEVEIRAGSTRTVTETLSPLAAPVARGRLSLTSDPPARVFLRGELLGETPLTAVEVPAGVLPLELETADGLRHRRGVVVRADDLSATHLDLTTR